MNKKDFPLQIHTDLNSLKTKFFKNFKEANTSSPLLRFEDLDESSSFYFEINSFKDVSSKGVFQYTVTYKPINQNKLEETSVSLNFSDLYHRLESWLNVIQSYDVTPHFGNNPILENYIEENYTEYEILDDDADIVSFDLRRQILIDNYLEKVIMYFISYEESNGENLEELKVVAVELKNTLTQSTKNQVVRKLSVLWAMARQKGIPILKEIFVELAKEVIIAIGKKAMNLN
ncbi:hypothetical protein [Flavobacterium sp. 1]|uniref:hypothetical protein n=1 Tax=Flavobacterium sp. 1 TaxID=2035200 RepID=UPI0012FDE7B9|nr:hypothetical protein [Flavobacterium sp. 1]